MARQSQSKHLHQPPSHFDRATLEAHGDREIRRYADFYELSKEHTTAQVLDILFSDRSFIPALKNDRSFRTAAVEGNILTRMGFSRASGRQINRKTQNRLFNPHKSLLASTARKELNQPVPEIRTPTPEPTPSPPPARGFKRKSTLARILPFGKTSSKEPETVASTSSILEMETITGIVPEDATTSYLPATEPELEPAPAPTATLTDTPPQTNNVTIVTNPNPPSSPNPTATHPTELPQTAMQPSKPKFYGEFPTERFPSPSESYSDDDDDEDDIQQPPAAAKKPNDVVHPDGRDDDIDGDSLSPGVRDSPPIGPFVYPPPPNPDSSKSNWMMKMLADVERQRSNLTSELEDAKAEVTAALAEVTLAQGELDEECACMQKFIELVGKVAGNDLVSKMVRDAQNTAVSDGGDGDGDGTGGEVGSDGDGDDRAEQAGGGIDNDGQGEEDDQGGGGDDEDEEEACDGDVDHNNSDDESSDDSDSDHPNPDPTFTLKPYFRNMPGFTKPVSIFSQQAIPDEGTGGLRPSQSNPQELDNCPRPSQTSSHTQTSSTPRRSRKRSHGDSESSDEGGLDTAQFEETGSAASSRPGRSKRARREANVSAVPSAPRPTPTRSPDSSKRSKEKMSHSSRATGRFSKTNNDTPQCKNESDDEDKVSLKGKRKALDAEDGRSSKRTRPNTNTQAGSTSTSSSSSSSSSQSTGAIAGKFPKFPTPHPRKRPPTSNNRGASSLASGSKQWRPRTTSTSSSSSSSDSASGGRETFAVPPGLCRNSDKEPLFLPSSPIVVPSPHSSPRGDADVLPSSSPSGEAGSSLPDIGTREIPLNNAHSGPDTRSRSRDSPCVLEEPCVRPSEWVADARSHRSSAHTPPTHNSQDACSETSAQNTNVPPDLPSGNVGPDTTNDDDDGDGMPFWRRGGHNSGGTNDQYEPLFLRRAPILNGILSELGVGPEHYATSEPGPSRPHRHRGQPLQRDRERVRETESGTPETYVPEEEPEYADRMRAHQQYLDEYTTYHLDNNGSDDNDDDYGDGDGDWDGDGDGSPADELGEGSQFMEEMFVEMLRDHRNPHRTATRYNVDLRLIRLYAGWRSREL